MVASKMNNLNTTNITPDEIKTPDEPELDKALYTLLELYQDVLYPKSEAQVRKLLNVQRQLMDYIVVLETRLKMLDKKTS